MRIYTISGHVIGRRAALLLVIISFALSLAVQHCARAVEGPGIQGIWQAQALQLVEADGSAKDYPVQENLFIFTDTHYSMAYAWGPKAPMSEKRFHPSDAEKVSRYNHMMATTGTYELDGSILMMHQMFATIPDVVDGTATLDFSLSGGTLTLTWKMSTSPDGAQPTLFTKGKRFIITLARVK